MLAAVALMGLGACERPVASSDPLPGERERDASSGKSVRERQMAFLNRLRAADPEERTIRRALLNEKNELGLILGRGVEMDKIPTMMRQILTEMAREFPGEHLTIIAYTPSDPPRPIGTARLNADTRDMTYTPAS